MTAENKRTAEHQEQVGVGETRPIRDELASHDKADLAGASNQNQEDITSEQWTEQAGQSSDQLSALIRDYEGTRVPHDLPAGDVDDFTLEDRSQPLQDFQEAAEQNLGGGGGLLGERNLPDAYNLPDSGTVRGDAIGSGEPLRGAYNNTDEGVVEGGAIGGGAPIGGDFNAARGPSADVAGEDSSGDGAEGFDLGLETAANYPRNLVEKNPDLTNVPGADLLQDQDPDLYDSFDTDDLAATFLKLSVQDPQTTPDYHSDQMDNMDDIKEEALAAQQEKLEEAAEQIKDQSEFFGAPLPEFGLGAVEDTVEAAGDAVEDTVEYVGEAVEDVGEAVEDAVEDFFGW